jgi:hypothetical protein
MVYDPIEDYDREWPEYRARHSGSLSEEEGLTAFVWEKDAGFRAEARAAIFCYNGAGLGTGINSMRLLASFCLARFHESGGMVALLGLNASRFVRRAHPLTSVQ